MINKIITFSIANKLFIGLLVLFIAIAGIYSFKTLPVDAVPDIMNNQVQVISIAPTLAANEVEQLITSPIEVAVANIPDVIELRSISRLGLSVVTIVFKDKTDIYWARQQISERLGEAEDKIPPGITKPELAPVSSGLGEIYQYVLHVKHGYEKKYNAMELRTIQDWIVRRELLGTPGVADVNSYGGFLKQYEISVDPEKLRGMGITLSQIFEALEKNNENTGSAYIDKKPNAYFIRGLGLVNSVKDIAHIYVTRNPAGLPVHIDDVATIQFGFAPRYGAFVVDTTGEGVGGVVMMLKGSNASKVVADVKERFQTISKSLPEGIEIEPYLDRTELVGRAMGTVTRNLAEGGIIVVFVLVLLLGNLRAGLVVASVIPLSMLFAISLMRIFGVSGNLMSLGAIDFGLIVDGAVIIVESVVHRITQSKTHHPGFLVFNRSQMDHEVLESSKRMMNSATFGQFIILIVYLPILALVGIEGKMFRPMAETVSFAILGAIILSLTWVPVASAIFLSKKTSRKRNFSDKIMDFIHKAFNPLLDLALRRKMHVVITSLILFIASIFVFRNLGGEFIPTLEEGDLAAGVITLQGGSLSNTIETVEKANKILMDKFPEVKHAICKIGAGEIPTDPTPMETGDYIISMKPKSEWVSAASREEMMEKMEKELSVLAGVKFEMQQPIQMRFNEFMSGSKQDVAIKLFGDNLEILAEKAGEIEKLLRPVEGVEDISVEKVTGSGQIQVKYNRDKIALYGLNIRDINQTLKTAFAGSSAGLVYEDEKRFELVVRLQKNFRDDIEHIKNLYIPLPSGGQVSMQQLADVEIKNGTAQISRESAKRRINIGFNVRNRDVESTISEIRKKIDRQLKLPAGYYTTYGGQFQNLLTAKKRLGIAVPAALFLIFMILFFTFHSVKQTLLIFSAVPFAAIGGIMALFFRNMHFSISAGVGFIALFGVAVLNGIVLIAEFNRLEKEENIDDIYERVRKGLKARLRPVIMTAAVASFGFLPMALTVSAGAEVQKPLATVVIGGLISSTILTLLILPVLYILFSEKRNLKNGKLISKNISVPLILLMLIFSGTIATAQTTTTKTYSLPEAVKRALEQNINLKSASLNVEYQQKLKKSAWNIGKTNIDYSYGQANSLFNDDNITISQSFEFPSVYINRSKLAKGQVQMAQTEFRARQIEISSEVRSCWYQLCYFHSKLRLLRYQDSLYTEFVRAVNLKIKKGESNELEKYVAETHLMNNRKLILQTTSDILLCRNKLQYLLNESVAVNISDSILTRQDIQFKLDSTTVLNNPSFQLLMQKTENSRIESRLEASKLWPDFSAGYFNLSNRDVQENYRFSGIQAGIAIPLVFGQGLAQLQAAKVNTRSLENEAIYARMTTLFEFRSLIEKYNNCIFNLDYYENTALKQAEKIIRQAGISFSQGDIGHIDYIHNLEEAIQIQSAYLDALNEQNQLIVSMMALAGII